MSYIMYGFLNEKNFEKICLKKKEIANLRVILLVGGKKMKENKLTTITNLFEGKEIRSIWDSEKEEYYFSVVDVIGVLTDSNDPSHYWRTLKSRMLQEGNETVTNCDTFKLKAKDGKMRNTDMLDTKGILRLIESVPSPKAEPFKLWLASVGSERIDEVFNPELAITRAVTYYRNRGYNDNWIEARLKGILNRHKLTDVWKEQGIKEPSEYAILTNEIYNAWAGMTASEYKKFKGLRKESLRDNMSDLEILLTDIGEVTTRELAKEKHSIGFEENKKVAKTGGKIADDTRKNIERNLGKRIVTNQNKLNYQYKEQDKIENK